MSDEGRCSSRQQFHHLSTLRSSPKWSLGGRSLRKTVSTPGPLDYSNVEVSSCKTRREPACTFGKGRGHKSFDSMSVADTSSVNTSLSSVSQRRSPTRSAREESLLTARVRGPGSHRLPREFPSSRSNPCFSFGTSRRGLDPVRGKAGKGSGRRLAERHASPGPGAYSPDPVSPDRPRVSIGRAPRNISPRNDDEPGPVEYASAMPRRTVSPAWGFGTRSRDLDTATPSEVPGPGAYHISRGDSPRHHMAGRHVFARREDHDVQFLPQFSQFVC